MHILLFGNKLSRTSGAWVASRRAVKLESDSAAYSLAAIRSACAIAVFSGGITVLPRRRRAKRISRTPKIGIPRARPMMVPLSCPASCALDDGVVVIGDVVGDRVGDGVGDGVGE